VTIKGKSLTKADLDSYGRIGIGKRLCRPRWFALTHYRRCTHRAEFGFRSVYRLPGTKQSETSRLPTNQKKKQDKGVLGTYPAFSPLKRTLHRLSRRIVQRNGEQHLIDALQKRRAFFTNSTSLVRGKRSISSALTTAQQHHARSGPMQETCLRPAEDSFLSIPQSGTVIGSGSGSPPNPPNEIRKNRKRNNRERVNHRAPNVRSQAEAQAHVRSSARNQSSRVNSNCATDECDQGQPGKRPNRFQSLPGCDHHERPPYRRITSCLPTNQPRPPL